MEKRNYETKYANDKFYHEWLRRVPALKFDPNWEVKVIPPFGGALVRFLVNEHTSVYLDVDNSLGYWNGPYWEVHPYNEDIMRTDMTNTDELMEIIRYSVKQRAEEV